MSSASTRRRRSRERARQARHENEAVVAVLAGDQPPLTVIGQRRLQAEWRAKEKERQAERRAATAQIMAMYRR